MCELALGVSSCPSWYAGGDFDAVTPWYYTHGMVMFWWRHVLLRPLWSHNVGLGSLLSGLYGRSLCFAGLLDGVLVDHPASQTCSLERGL